MVTAVVPSSASTFGNTSANITALTEQAEIKGLAKAPYWLALVHYKKSGAGNGQLISDIISPNFFLSKQGTTDPAAELAATIAALFKTPGRDPDNHAQCRFVARYKWLRKSLTWRGITPPLVNCASFMKWSLHGEIESLSLIFATGYLGNPASFYGHFVLRFNANRAIESNSLLDESLNYGAIIPDNESSLMYIAKGLFGGYEAGFSHSKFYRHNHNYTANELRDMWEYELAFTKDEVDQIVSHSWELLGNKFVYYFVSDNCAYRMSELLRLVINEPLLPESLPWSIPSTVLDRLMAIEKDGVPVVKKVKLIPSLQNRFYESYIVLDNQQQGIVKKLFNKEITYNHQTLRDLPQRRQIAIIDSLINYYSYLIALGEDDIELRHAKQEALFERLGFTGQSSATFASRGGVSPPHKGQLPSMMRLGLFYNNSFGEGFELRIRPSYYDLLALNAGRLPNSNLTMFDLRVVFNGNQIRLRSLDLVNVETLNISRTNLPRDGGLAWKVRFGLERQNLSCDDCIVASLVSGFGKAIQITQGAVFYGMLEGLIQTEHDNSGTLGGTARVGAVGEPLAGWKSRLETGYREYLNGTRVDTMLVRWENRFGRDRGWDIRFSFEENIDHEVQAAISFYW